MQQRWSHGSRSGVSGQSAGASAVAVHQALRPPRSRAGEHRLRYRHLRPAPVRTSEHWYEEEEEFDAVTSQLLPKRLHIVAQAAGDAGFMHAASQLQGVRFATAFCAPEHLAAATDLWSALQQGGPPLFKKVRGRPALHRLNAAARGTDVSAHGDELLQEVCSQTWRAELDFGLAGLTAPPQEDILLLCTRGGAHALLEAAGDGSAASTAAEAVLMVELRGWNEDGGQVFLKSWRQLRHGGQP